MEAVIAEVREKTRGEIAVVTLAISAIAARSDVALQIGRQWGVGAKGEAGDRAKNAGVSCSSFPGRITSRGRAMSSSPWAAPPRVSSPTRAPADP